jgi:protein TonB
MKHNYSNIYWLDRCIALFSTILLNFILFALMSGLIQSIPQKPSMDSLQNPIQVVRIKRPDTNVRKKEKTKPPKPEKKIIKKIAKSLTVSKPVPQKVRLPFQLNPKRSTGPQTLKVPAFDTMTLSVPALKDTYDSHEIDSPLTPLVKIPPMYPIRAKRLSIEGWVTVRFLVDTDGTVGNIQIIEAQPADTFENNVIQCVQKWKFQPGTVEGVSVKTWIETTIRFEMDDS